MFVGARPSKLNEIGVALLSDGLFIKQEKKYVHFIIK